MPRLQRELAMKKVAHEAMDTIQDDLSNVEFIADALNDPLNVLRIATKETAQLIKDLDVRVRRVIVITDMITVDGERQLDVLFSHHENETDADSQDSVLATITRLATTLALE